MPVRLQGQSSRNGTGRVEVFYNGKWGEICNHRWDFNDVQVACRQLGYKYAVRTLQGSEISHVPGRPIWLHKVACNGDERDLTSCFNSEWENRTCWKNVPAGVECSLTGIAILSFIAVAA